MATTAQRLAALETAVTDLKAWKTAHINGHVLSGHNHDPRYALTSHTHTSEPAPEPVPEPAPTPEPAPLPAPGTLPVGGDPALRGPKPFTYQTPTATLQAGASATQIEAAMSAGAVIRLGPGTFPGFTIRAAVTIECDPGTVTGGITSQANGWKWRGGRPANFRQWRAQPGGDDVLIEHVAYGPGGGPWLLLEKGNRWTVRNFDVTVNTSVHVAELWADNANGLSITGITFEHGLMRKTGGSGWSMVIGRSGGTQYPGRVKATTFRNVYVDGGTRDQGHFGIELFWGEDSLVEACDLRGGDVLLSIVRARRTIVRRTRHTLAADGAWGAFEHAGLQSTEALLEDNEYIGWGTAGDAVYHNSQATGLVFRRNRLTNMRCAVNYAGGDTDTGGGSVIEDNCLTNVANLIVGTTPVPPNISVARNGPC